MVISFRGFHRLNQSNWDRDWLNYRFSCCSGIEHRSGYGEPRPEGIDCWSCWCSSCRACIIEGDSIIEYIATNPGNLYLSKRLSRQPRQ